jgi:hypothetical protein
MVLVDNIPTEVFGQFVGLKQRSVLSLIVFATFIDSLTDDQLERSVGVWVGGMCNALELFADNLITRRSLTTRSSINSFTHHQILLIGHQLRGNATSDGCHCLVNQSCSTLPNFGPTSQQCRKAEVAMRKAIKR